MADGLPVTPTTGVPLEVRRDVACALLGVINGILAGDIDGLRIEWDGSAVCRIAAHRPDPPLVIPAQGRIVNTMKARG